jgi:hypothetical protein
MLKTIHRSFTSQERQHFSSILISRRPLIPLDGITSWMCYNTLGFSPSIHVVLKGSLKWHCWTPIKNKNNSQLRHAALSNIYFWVHWALCYTYWRLQMTIFHTFIIHSMCWSVMASCMVATMVSRQFNKAGIDVMCIRLAVAWSATCRDRVSTRCRAMHFDVVGWHIRRSTSNDVMMRDGAWLQSDTFSWVRHIRRSTWIV